MNWNERQRIKQRLMENLASRMIRHGIIKSDRERSNEYTCSRVVELIWRGEPFTIVQIDGETCRIDRK